MYDTNYYQRYHQEQGNAILHGFDRALIKSTHTKNFLGLQINITEFTFGNKIYRLDFFGKLIELWHIPKTSQDTFQLPSKETIRKPIIIELYEQKDPTFKNRLLTHLVAIPYNLTNLLLPKNTLYTKIYEMFGDHDIESSLFCSPKNLLFIRNKYLIKLAMDLKLLKGRDIAKQKQSELERPINSFDIVMADNQSFKDNLSELGDFNLIKDYDKRDEQRKKIEQKQQIEKKKINFRTDLTVQSCLTLQEQTCLCRFFFSYQALLLPDCRHKFF